MVIKAKQFTLRPFHKNDLADLVRNISDKEIAKNMARVPYPYTVKDGQAFLKRQLGFLKHKNPERIGFAIEIDGEMAGGFYFNKIEAGHKATIGYWLGRKFWGKGLMTKIVKKMVPLLMKKFRLKRIDATVFPYNKGSMGVLQNAGFKCEGVMKKSLRKGNCYLDEHIFAKIK
ncbi:MAG: GNAT family protein [Candidatus Parcubacteria bacterium]|nr:GNAT family protein [Candidatus Parcubacteria bacterium]